MDSLIGASNLHQANLVQPVLDGGIQNLFLHPDQDTPHEYTQGPPPAPVPVPAVSAPIQAPLT